MKRIIILFLVLSVIKRPAFSQSFSLSDSTITFRNQEGKILSKDEVQQLTKSKFSIRQELIHGRKIITILPGTDDENAVRITRLNAFRNSLVGQPVVDFHLTDLNNVTWVSKELQGKVVVINFWFIGCKPCIMEMPLLNGLVAEYRNNPVVFLAPAPEKKNQLNRFLNKFSFDYNIIPSSGEFISSLGVKSFPTHLIVDKKGIIREVFVGFGSDIKERLQNEINKLLNEEG